MLKTGSQGSAFSLVAILEDDFDLGYIFQSIQNLPSSIGAEVVDDHQFRVQWQGGHPGDDSRDGSFLVINRNDYR